MVYTKLILHKSITNLHSWGRESSVLYLYFNELSRGISYLDDNLALASGYKTTLSRPQIREVFLSDFV